MPALAFFTAPVRVPGRLEASVDSPLRSQLGRIGPKSDGQAGQVGGAQGRGFGDTRPHHRHPQEIGLHLHQQVVAAGAAIHPQLPQTDARILGHGAKHVGTLQGNRLQGGAGNVRRRGAARDAQQGATRMAIPVRRAQPGERRHQVDIAGVVDLLRQRLHFFGRSNQPQAVAQPLHGGAGNKNRALERVAGASCTWRCRRAAPGDGGQQLVLAGDGRAAGVHQHETTGAIGVLRHAGCKTGLPEGGGLLIACHTGNRQRSSKQLGQGRIDQAAGRHHLRQQRRWNFKQCQQLRVPLQGMDIEQQGARRIAGIRHMASAAGQVPHQPTVDGAKRQLAALGAGACARHVVQQPLQLGAGEIRIENQPGLALNDCRVTLGAQDITPGCGAPVLPDDRIGQRLPGLAIPQHGGFALVCDTHSAHLGGADTGVLERGTRHGQLRAPDFSGIVLDPARLRKDLAKFLLRHSRTVAAVVEQDGAGAGGALVKREDVLHGVARLAQARVSSQCSCSSRHGQVSKRQL